VAGVGSAVNEPPHPLVMIGAVWASKRLQQQQH